MSTYLANRIRLPTAGERNDTEHDDTKCTLICAYLQHAYVQCLFTCNTTGAARKQYTCNAREKSNTRWSWNRKALVRRARLGTPQIHRVQHATPARPQPMSLPASRGIRQLASRRLASRYLKPNDGRNCTKCVLGTRHTTNQDPSQRSTHLRVAACLPPPVRCGPRHIAA